jgi:hypothetical protein
MPHDTEPDKERHQARSHHRTRVRLRTSDNVVKEIFALFKNYFRDSEAVLVRLLVSGKKGNTYFDLSAPLPRFVAENPAKLLSQAFYKNASFIAATYTKC